jgi:osmoprotectant transport system ATP-binding protein
MGDKAMPILSFNQVSYWYGNQQAVKNLSFALEPGEFAVIIGPSGCGKSTTLKMVNRLLEPGAGTIQFMDRPLASYDPVELRRTMGYAIQNVGLFPHWTVFDNVATVPRLLRWPKDNIKLRVLEILYLVGLAPEKCQHKYPSELSGGEAQRVGIARALAADPPLLLMDEPFGALDPLQRSRHQQALLDIQSKIRKTILMVTHDLDEAILLADRILIMNNGQLVQWDTPEAILKSPANAFVRKFVGSDRSLKRLIRRTVGELMSEALPIELGKPRIPDTGRTWTWVVDQNQVLKGWLTFEATDNEHWEDIISPLPGTGEAATLHTSLKDALSLMLSAGMKVLPVVDASGRLLGEISMDAIEVLIKEGDHHED